jgi:predicted RNA-binding protein YlqC (UPF0109 family)
MAPDDDYEDGDINTVADAEETDSSLEYEDGDVNTVADAHFDDDDDEEATGGNRAADDLATGVLNYIARSLVEEPDAVTVHTSERQGGVRLQLHVGPEDMGRVIGRRGRTAQAIRTLVGVAGAREGVQTSVDIVDD